MSFIFTMRSTPTGSMHQPPSPGSLPAISEDGTSFVESRGPPPIPIRASNRPSPRNIALGAPLGHNYETNPLAYSYFSFDNPERPNGEKLAEVRKGFVNNKHIAKRGGWKRLLIIGIILALIIVGLVVGLVIGLRKQNKSSSSKNSSSSSPAGGASGNVGGGPNNPVSNTTFPAGSYSFNTFLDTVSTNCTSKAATWLCYPYNTYAQDPSSSAATFQWIINPVANSQNYTISSTENVFSIVFTNLTLSLLNSGQADEHYFFQTGMQKPTKPASQLGSQNVASTCYFNQTTFQGYLYTKMAKTYPSNSTNTMGSSTPFSPWPYAVKVEQVSAAGVGTPTCLDPSGQSLGDFSVADGSQLCDCLYLNTGT